MTKKLFTLLILGFVLTGLITAPVQARNWYDTWTDGEVIYAADFNSLTSIVYANFLKLAGIASNASSYNASYDSLNRTDYVYTGNGSYLLATNTSVASTTYVGQVNTSMGNYVDLVNTSGNSYTDLVNSSMQNYVGGQGFINNTYNSTYDAKNNYNASYWTGTNYNSSYLTSTFNDTYDAKPDSTFNSTYEGYNASIIAKGLPTYDALVYQDSTYTYALAKNGTVLNKTLTASNIGEYPLQAALNSITTNGGHIHLGSGTFSTASEISYATNKPIKITGNGEATIITGVTAGMTVLSIGTTSTPVTGVYLEDFQIYGTSPNVGLVLGGAYDARLKNVKVRGNKVTGLDARYGHTMTLTGCVFIENEDGVPPTANEDAVGVKIGNSSTYAFNVVNFIGCRIETNGNGVKVVSGNTINFQGSTIEGNRFHGVWLEPASGASVKDVKFDTSYVEYNNLYEGAGKRDINSIGSQNGVIENCIFTSEHEDYPVYLNETSTGWQVIGGAITDGVTMINDTTPHGSTVISGVMPHVGRLGKNLLVANQSNGCENGSSSGLFSAQSVGTTIEAEPTGTTAAWQGSYSLNVTVPGSADYGEGSTLSNAIPVTPGQTYTYSGYTKGAAGEHVTVYVYYLDISGSYVASSAKALTLTAGWTRFVKTDTLPATAYNIQYYITTTHKPTAGFKFYVDGMQLEEGSIISTWNAPRALSLEV